MLVASMRTCTDLDSLTRNVLLMFASRLQFPTPSIVFCPRLPRMPGCGFCSTITGAPVGPTWATVGLLGSASATAVMLHRSPNAWVVAAYNCVHCGSLILTYFP